MDSSTDANKTPTTPPTAATPASAVPGTIGSGPRRSSQVSTVSGTLSAPTISKVGNSTTFLVAIMVNSTSQYATMPESRIMSQDNRWVTFMTRTLARGR